VTPLFGSPLRAALELGAGESWGSPPIQRSWFLGGSANLRGYHPSVLVGPAFTRARVELGWVFPASTVSLFGDGGWAGERLDAFESRDALFSVGLGFGVLDGLIRLDVARGLRDPKSTRWDLYLDGIL
jgi:hemolysin activation/secretion protein